MTRENENWHNWKATLKTAINLGEAVGMSEDSIAKVGTKIGDFLSNNVDPTSTENRLLKELWEQGNHEDREKLSKMLVRMIERD